MESHTENLPATSSPAPSRQRVLTLPSSPEEAMFLGETLMRSGLLPDHIRKPEQAMYLILAGAEMGMPATRALRSLQIVKGKVVESADSQLARFKECGGRATFIALDDTRAELKLRHPNGDEHTEVYTLEDAKRAGLLANQNWQKHPRAMLRSRAITAGLKSVGYIDAVGAYDPDEAREFAGTPSALDDAPPPVVVSSATPDKRPGRKSFAAKAPEVVVESPPVSETATHPVVVESGTDDATIVGPVTGVFRKKDTDTYVIAIAGVRYSTTDVELARTAKAAQGENQDVACTLDGDSLVSLTVAA